MRQPRLAIQNVADTAWWTAAIRAVENNRADALFHDPFAPEARGGRLHWDCPLGIMV